MKWEWLAPYWQQLVQAKQQQRLPHALLITGPMGVGKRALAMAFTQLLLCQSPTDDHVCGECRSCQMATQGTHPDWLKIEPEESGKTIKIDQIRRLVNLAHQSHLLARYRVIQIQPAESMNIAASNALLKTLEEPAKNTLILLLASDVMNLPATIISRCQKMAIHPPEPSVCLEILLNEGITQAEDAELLLKLAHGAPLKAISLAKTDALQQYRELDAQLNALQQHQLDPMAMAKQLVKLNLNDVIDWLQTWLMDCIHNHGNDKPQYFFMLDELNALKSAVLRKLNLNPQLALEVLLMRLTEE